MKHIINEVVDECDTKVADRIMSQIFNLKKDPSTCLSEKEDILKAEIERDRMNDDGEDYHEYVDNNL